MVGGTDGVGSPCSGACGPHHQLREGRRTEAAVGAMAPPRETGAGEERYKGTMTRRLVPALALAISAAACGFPKTADAPPPLSAGDASAAATRWPGATPQSLAHGRELFVAKCNGCHGYPDLASIDEARWPAVVDRMGEKADLAAKDREDVLRFVLAARSAGVAR